MKYSAVKKLFSFMGSPRLTAILVFILLAAVFAETYYTDADIAVYHSWWFSLVLITLIHNLAIFTIKRFKHLRINNTGSFIVCLGAILLALSIILGIKWGIHGQMRIASGKTELAYKGLDGKKYSLPFAITLEEFKLKHGDFGSITVRGPELSKPLKFAAVVGKQYRLDNYDCILEIVDYAPDFYMLMPEKTIGTRSLLPKNPALHVALKGSRDCDTWLFHNYPELQDRHGNKSELPFGLFYEWSENISLCESHIKVTNGDNSTKRAVLNSGELFSWDGYYLRQRDYDKSKNEYIVMDIATYPALNITYISIALMIGGAIVTLLTKLFFKKPE